MKILIVEDDKVSRKLVESILNKNGFETLSAASVQKGISYLESKTHFSLIILDIMMHDEDGYALLRYLNKQNSKMKIPVLMCSTASDKFSVIQSYSLGAIDYLKKPIESKPLLAKVNNILNSVNRTILVVDDEKIIRDLLKNTLEHEKFNVLTADSGMTALEVMASNNVNVVISDIQMDEMNGMDLLVQIKSLYSDVPVLMITGHYTKYEKDDVIAAGADGYIIKPFKNIEVIKSIHKALQQKLVNPCIVNKI